MKKVTMLVVLACITLTGFSLARAGEEYGALTCPLIIGP